MYVYQLVCMYTKFANIIPEWYLSVNYFTHANDVTNSCQSNRCTHI